MCQLDIVVVIHGVKGLNLIYVEAGAVTPSRILLVFKIYLVNNLNEFLNTLEF